VFLFIFLPNLFIYQLKVVFLSIFPHNLFIDLRKGAFISLYLHNLFIHVKIVAHVVFFSILFHYLLIRGKVVS